MEKESIALQLLNPFLGSDKIQAITEMYQQSDLNPYLHLTGLRGSAESFVISAVAKHTNHYHVVIVNDKEEAAYLSNDLEAILGKKHVLFFPSSARLPYHVEKTDNANVLQRSEVLESLSNRKHGLVMVTYPEALAEKVITRKELQKNILEVKVGDSLSLDFINELFNEYKFERVDFVSEPGHFAIRGGIVDVFSYHHDTPFRIEFFGDEVDSIRTFDPASQLSEAHFKHVTVVPNLGQKAISEERTNVLNFFTRPPVVWAKDINFTSDRIGRELDRAEKAYAELSETLNHLKPEEMFATPEEFVNTVVQKPLITFGNKPFHNPDKEIEFNQTEQPVFNKNFELLASNLSEHEKAGFDNWICSGSAKQLSRLDSIFEDLEQKPTFKTALVNFHSGFVDSDLKIAYYTDHQIFERFHRFRLKEGFKDAQQRLTIKELTGLKKGDFVVHVDHGVGEFAGLVTQNNNGKQQEAIKLVYKDGDVLYVSIHSLHRISKFTGKEGTAPTVHKLGTGTWKKMKAKTKSNIKKVAFDLIQLYAKRKAQKGFAFTPDTYLQTELEASFIYEDTPDQEKATEAIKIDMEKEYPMDRLVCGDVGFGKTELAIRAAFKAATDGKQVAILVPTTILALQHYKSFKKRLDDFPVTVDYINRFKTAKQTRESLEALAEGKTDIMIGTHKLVGKNVKFKDLGLMIIDEEQKFGVSIKDKLKTMKVNVDTLTLTATPIPRTLQFSLMGARDLSILNTPPPNRQPVHTEHHAFNEEVVRDAIMYELSRDGQVFVINNRIQNIQEVAGMIQRVVPGARVVTAHGQMDGKELEKRMMGFVDGEYDVLVATSIIESGLDIPNANTIIIYNAQNFGLSDLHQMRGRVGRSNKKAFCLLIAPPLSSMTDEARKRMNAITQFSELGSGFNIAMRDLDIRGAGNLLGGEQSGFMSDIGYEMYQKILNEAIDELKQTEFKDLYPEEEEEFVKETQIDTDLELLIPNDYVNQIAERLGLYRKLADFKEENQLVEFGRELTDRFGPMPLEVERLFDSMRLKWVAQELGFEQLIMKNGVMLCYFTSNPNSAYFSSPIFATMMGFINQHPQHFKMKQRNDRVYLVVSGIETVERALKMLQRIHAQVNPILIDQ